MSRGTLHRATVSHYVLMLAGCMGHGGTAMTEPRHAQSAPFSADTNAAVVRYQVRDVDRAVAFYTRHLGFQLTQRPGPVLAILSRGHLHLILSGPGSSGSRPMPEGRQQEPGGWNRIVLYVENLDSTLAALGAAEARFRNQVEVGPGGKQIQVDDPDGNPIELHEAPGK
jgi:glyoxylase I family protein